MKKNTAILLFLAVLITAGIYSVEIELSGGIGNLTYDKEQTSALSSTANPGQFTPLYYPLILARFSGEYKSLIINAGFKRDPLLSNRLFGNLRAEFNYFHIETGPVIGVFNSSALPINPGISAALGLTIPGIVFVHAEAFSTIGARTETTGNYSQLSGDLSAGFWVPHVICSANMSLKTNTVREEVNLLIEDSYTRYFFRADVFTKNVPFTIKIDLGFENLNRSYTAQKIDSGQLVREMKKDEFKLFFGGIEVTYTLNSLLKFYLGGEIPVYSWAVHPMRSPPANTLLFEARMGVVLNIAGRID